MHSIHFKKLAAFILVQLALVAGMVYAIWDFTAPLRAREAPRPARPVKAKPPLDHTVTGKVLGPDGQPVSDAEVCFAGDGYFRVKNSRFGEMKEGLVRTNAEGEFSLPVCPGPVTIFADHEQGYASAVLKSAEPEGIALTLRPWSEVEVKLLHGDKPVAGANITLSMIEPEQPTPNFTYQTNGTTDPQGVAVFRRVIAGFGRVRVPKIESEDIDTRIEGGIETRVGERQSVTIGGRQNMVTGVVTNDRGFTPSPIEEIKGRLNQVQQKPKPPDGLSDEDARIWYAKWRDTPEGRRDSTNKSIYFFKLQRDGKFALGDLLPGQYDLLIERQGPDVNGGFPVPLEFFQASIDVPSPGEDGTPNKRDLGVLRLTKATIMPGDSAEDFSFTTLDGTAHRLGDFRGKHVLLNFWASSSPSDRELLPQLRTLHETYAPSGKLVLIGLSGDPELETLKRFAAKEPLPGLQVFLGSQNLDTVEKQFGFWGYSTGVLIDPQGKIIASGLRTDDMVAAVEKALGTP